MRRSTPPGTLEGRPMKKSIVVSRAALLSLTVGSIFVAGVLSAKPPESNPQLEITRPVRTWEFLCSVGKQAAIFGNESGRIEGWVYPLKLFRDFSLTFHTEDRALPAETLARTITVRPESTTILYVGNTFRVKETFFTPVDEPGAIIRMEVETEQPLEIEATFRPDFQLEWPAALGATYSSWDARLHATTFGVDHREYAGILGSPTGTISSQQFDTNYNSSSVSGMRLGATAHGNETKLIVLAASINGSADAEKSYQKLIDKSVELERDSANYYSQYLQRTVIAEIPDSQLQQAYDWSRVSVLQGVVKSPYLGSGLIAGYRTSGESQRPGFAWYFGRDSEWTSFAFNSIGDFSTTKDALNFLIKFQQANGRIPHEIAQTASLVNWFKDYPYGTASADATPLFIIAVEDYVRTSGDIAFARDHWNNLWTAYQFLRSTYDENGLPKNFGVGHGWIEGGPLLPLKSEIYQSGVGAESLRALSELAKWTGNDAEAKTLSDEFAKQQKKVNTTFWSPEKNIFALAINQENKQVIESSVLATVPMWFSLLDNTKSRQMISQLSRAEHATDWGMRIISNRSANYSAGGYHFGSVWPLFTGWAAVGEYNYHQVHPALQNLRANALLALDGSPGHVTEVLSGDYYQGLSTSSPHQIWSAAMVVSPLLRGLFGVSTDAVARSITLAPSLPADWTSFNLRNLRAGSTTVDVKFHRTANEIDLEIHPSQTGEFTFEFQPALSLRAEVVSVELNGHLIPFQMRANESDQHLITQFPIAGGASILRVHVRDDFGITYTSQLPALGRKSEGLRILSEAWNAARSQLTLELEGIAGRSYEFSLFNGKEITNVEGGTIAKLPDGTKMLSVMLQGPNETQFVRATLVLHFAAPSAGKRMIP
jgi:glycogen debranching enzyme